MIRTLSMIALAGFLLSVVCISIAVSLAGPEAIASGAWGWNGHGWLARHVQVHDEFTWDNDSGAEAERRMVWTGGQTLDVDVPADVTYTQGSGPATMVVSGPKDALDHLTVQDGRVSVASGHLHGGDLTITLTAPNVTRFGLSGSGKLDIEGYKQDDLALDVSGDGDVTAKGEAKRVRLTISGSGDADLDGLSHDQANVDISGSGSAHLAPKSKAQIAISGSGDVTLGSRPAHLTTDVTGSGHIEQPGG